MYHTIKNKGVVVKSNQPQVNQLDIYLYHESILAEYRDSLGKSIFHVCMHSHMYLWMHIEPPAVFTSPCGQTVVKKIRLVEFSLAIFVKHLVHFYCQFFIINSRGGLFWGCYCWGCLW